MKKRTNQVDIIGTALLDYLEGNYTEDIRTQTNITQEDNMSLPHLFRDFDKMPKVEQKALQLSRGRVLDVGCGAGNHTLYLQEKGLQVTAIDTSPGAIEVCKRRNIIDVRLVNLLDFTGEKFDTILLMMNGTGIFQTLAKTPVYLNHLKKLLSPEGQILIDTTDLRYMYDSNENGSIWIPADMNYYGELTFTMKYKSLASEEFPWLYLDIKTFRNLAETNGYNLEIIHEGDYFDYLARLTLKNS